MLPTNPSHVTAKVSTYMIRPGSCKLLLTKHCIEVMPIHTYVASSNISLTCRYFLTIYRENNHIYERALVLYLRWIDCHES